MTIVLFIIATHDPIVAGITDGSGIATQTLITQTKNGLNWTPHGVTIHAWGAPDSGQIYKVTSLYN